MTFISTCAGVGGGWRRIAHIDIRAGDDCPGEWRKATQCGVKFCRVASNDADTCSSASFSTNGISYQRVCGRARGYQKGDTHPFKDGLIISYGDHHKHIWTFASGRGEKWSTPYNCPCSPGGMSPPSSVGENYYCEAGSWYYNLGKFFFNDTLWDGVGCVDHCCNNTTQPWFYRQLSQTVQDDIEARICTERPYTETAILIDHLVLYIQ